MTPFRADLHTHTCYSDGTATPAELVDLAIAYNLCGLSITDHDTVSAYSEAIPYAREKQFPLISGVEFSATTDKEPVHILGYSFMLNHKVILEFCSQHQKRRLERNQKILDRLNQKGFPLSEEDIYEALPQDSLLIAARTLGRPHIALAMMRKRYVESVQEAFKRFLGEGKPCFIPGFFFSVEETIDVIHQANGFAIIAHPHLFKKTETMHKLLQMPFDGIEAYYARISPNREKKWLKIAEKKQWLITGGSDFHGTVKPTHTLATSWTPEHVFQILQERFGQNMLSEHIEVKGKH